MSEQSSRTTEKALAINLDPTTYGTIVEIGAGQEVARQFFQAGAAAGTIAKTMSAYDMKFSDEIYGAAPGNRYVSRARLDRMLEVEYQLVIERIQDQRPPDTRFFAFADSVAAQGFKKRADCHGWLGVRFQLKPKTPPDNIILHVRMFDDTNLKQQEALGILGVNLIYGAYNHTDQPVKLLAGLMDNLRRGRVEIDLIEFSGPNLGAIDNHLMALELVKAGLTRAVLFDPAGKVVSPADVIYKKRVLAMRGQFLTVEQQDIDRFSHAKQRFQTRTSGNTTEILSLAELTMAQMFDGQKISTTDFLERVNRLAESGYYVLISEFFRYFRLNQYLDRYSREPTAFVTDLEGFGEVFNEGYYDNIPGGILEALGQLFTPGTVLYVYTQGLPITLNELPVEDGVRPLLSYLHARGQIEIVDEDPSLG